MKRFKNKTILVTGASSGIGREVAIAISKQGGNVVLLGRNSDQLEETISRMDSTGKHLFISYDLNDFAHYNLIFDRVKKERMVLDGLVHCAGTTSILPLRVMNVNNAMQLFNIHYFAFIELVKHYAKKGVANGGSVVAISAINAHVPQKCMTAYAAAKAAVESSCRTLALELTEKNIRINSVVVGGVSTEMSDDTSNMIQAVNGSYINPVQRQLLKTATPDQLVGPILFLLSDESSYITGRELYADGGLF